MTAGFKAPLDVPFQKQLIDLGLISPKRVEVLWPRTRDTNLPVLWDPQTGVVFLSELPDLETHYSQKIIGKEKQAEVPTQAGILKLKRNEDLERRYAATRDLIRGKDICDFGTGQGLYLDKAMECAASVSAVEIRDDLLSLIQQRLGQKPRLYHSLTETQEAFDVVTMFHVLEHLPDQLAALIEVKDALRPRGTVFIEVPHARDFLAMEMALPAYRDFIYWSEHLVLHSRESLSAFLEAAGFEDIRVEGFQRYGFANHLYWLRHAKPGGHEHFAAHSDDAFDAAYASRLIRMDRTDTLIATARKP